MSPKDHNLHGNALDKAEVPLLLIELIDDLEFPEGDQQPGRRPSPGRAEPRRRAAELRESKGDAERDRRTP